MADALEEMRRASGLVREMNHAARNCFIAIRQYKSYETSEKKDAEDRREYLEIAKGELDRAGLDDCGDPDCEHCQGDTE